MPAQQHTVDSRPRPGAAVIAIVLVAGICGVFLVALIATRAAGRSSNPVTGSCRVVLAEGTRLFPDTAAAWVRASAYGGGAPDVVAAVRVANRASSGRQVQAVRVTVTADGAMVTSDQLIIGQFLAPGQAITRYLDLTQAPAPPDASPSVIWASRCAISG